MTTPALSPTAESGNIARGLVKEGNSFTTGTSLSRHLSPAVKRLLDENRLEYSAIPSSGKGGRLLKGDVLQYLKGEKSRIQSRPEGGPSERGPPSPFDDVPNTNVRSVIAKRLTQAKSTIPHTYTSIDCSIDKLHQLRRKFKDDGVIVSLNDFIIKASAMTLKLVPGVNVRWTPDGPRDLPTIDVSVAMATKDGLITPIVKEADTMGVATISQTFRGLSSRARAGKLQLHEFQGGSFSISNLGMYGVSEFKAVINPPQVCILAVGSSRMEYKNSMVTSTMTVTMSSDARAVDTDLAIDWLKTFKQCIEEPSVMS